MSGGSNVGRRIYRVDPSSALASAWKVAGGIGLLGAVGAAFGFVRAHDRFAYSYLFAFFAVLTLALGFLFFVLIQHLTGAGWSVTVRRLAEFFMSGLVIFPVLAIPLLLSTASLFPWMSHGGAEHGESAPAEEHHSALDFLVRDANAAPPAPPSQPAVPGMRHGGGSKAFAEELEQAEHAEHAEILHGKLGYLNRGFFYTRAVAYFAFWCWISITLFRLSTEQDKTKKLENTVKAQRLAPVATILFGLTLTFAAIDWTMALEPLWYSTMYGVYAFAAGVVAMFALLTLVALAFRRSGLMGNAITAEHFHDLGKLTFGFLIFWAYITFSQFFLVWYSNIPEELTYYHRRWPVHGGAWKVISLALFFVKFVIPFLVLLSRNVKRHTVLLAIGAAIIVVMHVVEMYWVVMPNYASGAFAPNWLDLACLLTVGGLYLAVVLRNMTAHSLIPVGDPRLERAEHFQNA